MTHFTQATYGTVSLFAYQASEYFPRRAHRIQQAYPVVASTSSPYSNDTLRHGVRALGVDQRKKFVEHCQLFPGVEYIETNASCPAAPGRRHNPVYQLSTTLAQDDDR